MKKYLLVASVIVFLWLIPWVFSFYLGAVVYFPYEADGQSRFTRITGPLPAALGLDDDWVSGADIPANCKASVIAAEDGNFLDHNGIDVDSIKEAIKRNSKNSKRKIGASTVTQQLVKNVFLYRDKTYLRKAREIVGALMLDFIMSKDRQLTWYLNVVEFGPRVYGLRQASQYYFRKNPNNLSLYECASLVSLLRDPGRSSKYLKSGRVPPYLAARRDSIVAGVTQWGILWQLKENEG